MAMSVRGLERLMEEWLRPLVETRQWDYCVVWRLGHDPSRFIEMVGCCCGGGYGCAYVKDKQGEGQIHTELCRDGFIEHRIKTKACEALAMLPDSMPLYSGVHTEVVILDQPRWITGAGNASDSKASQSHDSNGTRVLIPVLLTGLIELFATSNIPENTEMLDFLTDSFTVNLKASASLYEVKTEPMVDMYLQNWSSSPNLCNLSPRPQAAVSLIQSTSCPSLEGSSSISNLSTEHPSFDYSLPVPHGTLKTLEIPSLFKKPKCRENKLLMQPAVPKDNVKATRRIGSGTFSSKNLTAERKRRSRIKEAEFALRALVPKITKMDRYSIPSDAIEYIKELQKKRKELEEELRELEEEDSAKSEAYLQISPVDKKGGSNCMSSTDRQNFSSFTAQCPMQVHVEVYQLGERDCLIKLFSEHNRGGFTRLMETMDYLGLEVVDANVTTFDRNTLIILRVEANVEIQAMRLREMIVKLTRETNSTSA